MKRPVPRPQGAPFTFRDRCRVHGSVGPAGRHSTSRRRGHVYLRVAEGAAREETFMVEDDFGPWDD